MPNTTTTTPVDKKIEKQKKLAQHRVKTLFDAVPKQGYMARSQLTMYGKTRAVLVVVVERVPEPSRQNVNPWKKHSTDEASAGGVQASTVPLTYDDLRKERRKGVKSKI